MKNATFVHKMYYFTHNLFTYATNSVRISHTAENTGRKISARRSANRLPFCVRNGTISDMESSCLAALDEYFCARYSDYPKICAIEGYVMPETLVLSPGGGIEQAPSSVMLLSRQKDAPALLAKFKAARADTDLTFNFAVVPVFERLKDVFRKYTFAKLLPAVLSRCKETAESAGAKLDIEPRFWTGIVKGKLYPEKNLILALALVTGMQMQDLKNLLATCGFVLETESVRDVVAEYLVENRVHNAAMRDACLAEYKIDCLPIKKGE